MKTTVRIFGVMVIAVLVAFAVRATQEINRARTTVAMLAPQRDALRAKIVGLEIRLHNANDSSAQLGKELAALGVDPDRESPHAKPGTSAIATPKKPISSSSPSPLTLVANDPQKWAEYRKNYRDSVELNYGATFKWLGLTPEQIERFKDAEVWCQETSIDLGAAAELHRLDPDSAEYKKLWSDYNKSRVTKKEEALGDLTAKYLEYFRTESVRWYPRELVYAGVFSGESISAAQVEHAADILVANCKRQGMTGPATKSGPWAYPSGLNWPAARAQLKDVLSPQQIETLGLLIAQDQTKAKLDERREVLTAQFKGQRRPQ